LNRFWAILWGLEQAYVENRTKLVGIRQNFAQQGLFSGNFVPLARFYRYSAQACARFRPKMSGFGTGKTPKFSKICRDWDQAFW
jgi:hypothetical protein